MLLDLGNLAVDETKYPMVLDVAKMIGYDLLVYGPMDLAVRPDVADLMTQRRLGICRPVPGTDGPHIWAGTVGAREVAVVHLVEALHSPGPRPVQEADAPLTACLRSARRSADYVVLVTRLGLTGVRRLLADDAVADLVDLVMEADEAVSSPTPVEISGTPVILPRRGGSDVGRLAVTFRDQEPSIAVEWRTVTREAPRDRRVHDAVTRLLAASPEDGRASSLLPKTEWGFVPATTCAQCHPPEAEAWAKSAHAQAVESLRREGRFEPSCLRCHSEYYRRNQQASALPAREDGVQCATCHGDGIVHAHTQARADILLNGEPGLCVDCHTEERSPRFQLETYLRRSSH